MGWRLFAQSRWDAILVGATVGEVALTAFTTIQFGKLPGLLTLGLAGACFLLKFWNFQCPAHNFVHLPYFRSDLLNRIFSLLSSITIASPQTLFRVHHLNHHRYNNARPVAERGFAGDLSSTYRFSRTPDREENFLAYSAIGPWRTDYAFLYAGAKKHGDATFVWIETAALALYVATLALLNWRGTLLFLLPLAYLDHAATYAHNYLEHHLATCPGSRLKGAVSSYGRLYNLISCNNGHHQEHHFRPQVHWTRLPELRPLMLPDHERRVVPHAHLFNIASQRRGPAPAERIPQPSPADSVVG